MYSKNDTYQYIIRTMGKMDLSELRNYIVKFQTSHMWTKHLMIATQVIKMKENVEKRQKDTKE